MIRQLNITVKIGTLPPELYFDPFEEWWKQQQKEKQFAEDFQDDEDVL